MNKSTEETMSEENLNLDPVDHSESTPETNMSADTGDALQPTDNEQATEDTESPADNGGPAGKARKEAARYRSQLRAVEARANAMRDQLIEQQLGTGGLTITALTAAGIDLDTLFSEDGRVSAEAVQEASDATRKALGIPNNRFNGTADQGSVRLSNTIKTVPTWGNLLDPTNLSTKQ